MTTPAEPPLAPAFRQHWGPVVATLCRLLGDLHLAEEAAADAFAVAVERWPRDGEPRSPLPWLVTTARNRALDRLRREQVLARRQADLCARLEQETPSPHGYRDDQLALFVACCHPSLPPDTQAALALRHLAGWTTAEVAAALLLREATLQQRLVRAKRTLRAVPQPFQLPPPDQLDERLAGVRAVLYLLFTRGHDGRPDLAVEAQWLARALAELVPGDAECWGLLALMRLHDARRDARHVDGELVLLADQDPARWDVEQAATGHADLDRALALGRGPFVVQALVAAQHLRRPVDWRPLLVLHTELLRMTASPVVALNRAVVVAEVQGPGPALALVDDLALDGYGSWHATRADLLRRLARHDEAAAAYRAALALTADGPERRFLARRLAGTTA